MRHRPIRALARAAGGLLFTTGLLLGGPAQALNFDINVVDAAGGQVSGFRWVLQEDTTFAVDPTAPAPLDRQLALNFHKSHHPIALRDDGTPLNGNTDGVSEHVAGVGPGRYYLTVLPYSGHAMGGAPVVLTQGGGGGKKTVTVTVEEYPMPTAQIAVYLFHDCYPLNGTPDLPEEEAGSGACPWATPDFTQFNVIVEEPGGKYGANGGPLLQDAFGNPLGTTYDGQGNVAALGDGTLTPNPDGTLLIKNLAPGKYGIIVTPPTGAGWTQTSTIEGTPVIDAWVKANEPPYMVEFGLPGPHVFIGFTQEHEELSAASGATVSGMITDMHMSRPPATQVYSGRPFPQCWVAINENNGVQRMNRYAMPCNADSTFSIPNVPAGSYEMKVFDTPLDVVIATMAFTVDEGGTCNGGQSCDFGEVPVFNWFNRLTTYIFSDDNQNGFWDVGESSLGAESGPVNVRWRDGTVYQSFPTDFDGVAPFDESFPWFHWMVAEVGFTNKKATGLTTVVDAGGEVNRDASLFQGFQELPGIGELTPQLQAENGDLPWRTETGPVLTQAFQGFLGQTNIIQFGKSDYLNYDYSTGTSVYVGENGGITGIVFNTVTRAENDPQLAVGEGWEPGVPRVQVNLYADGDIDAPVLAAGEPAFPDGTGDIDWNANGTYEPDDNFIDDVDGDGTVTLADVDNYPLGWAAGGPMGNEDIDRNGNGAFDLGDALAVTWTDSWDDNTPTGCQGLNNMTADGIADDRCFDGMRNWNQVRPGVFDGGYAFSGYDLVHLGIANPVAAGKINGFYDYVYSNVSPAVWDTLQIGLLPGDYIVEATTPPGYKTLREHHKNVDFGDEYTPATAALPPSCVGPEQPVPPYFAIATKDGSGAAGQLIAGIAPGDAAAPFANQMRPLCDQKLVPLSAGQNAAADFFLVSDVPVAANVTGIILNDLANEFNPNSPNFGEKYAPPLMPIGFYDWNGREVNRVYADEYGRYNAMVPSTYSANLPQPSGMSPNMLIACMNDAGPIPDPNSNNGGLMIDPFFDPAFSQFCYTLQYMPGSATYLDTPVVAVAAFATPVTFPVDCEQPNRTPVIASVERTQNGGGRGGPFVVTYPQGNGADRSQQIIVRSKGTATVPNPEYDGTNERTITRDYSFANKGNEVVLTSLADEAITYTLTSNNANQASDITVDLPRGIPPGDYQVTVRSNYGILTRPVESPIGVTLTVGVCQGTVGGNRTCDGTEVGVRPNAADPFNPAAGETYAVHSVDPASGTPIQDAIKAAQAGDLILVSPGQYNELVVMWKPVKLQGWGAEGVVINARQTPTEKVQLWSEKIDALLADNSIDMLPGQENAIGNFPALGVPAFATEQGAGIFVAGNASLGFGSEADKGARIDGFTVLGASQGGGIVVNGYAPDLYIGNNLLTANSGFYGGGIRVGHPGLSFQDGNDLVYTDAMNDRVRIHHNLIKKNGGTGGAGGGISLHTGADAYRVDHNWVCGNFSQGNGGGIGHLGLSDGGRIDHNDIVFNESFSQANPVNGGGIYVGGETALQATGGLLLSDGSGNVTIEDNRIHGNMAGAGDGGAISIVSANGMDINDHLDDSTAWYNVNVINNMITNNVAGLAGAVTLQDAVEVHLLSNTVAHNDSTATAALAFTPGYPGQSNPLPAGIVSRLHGPNMATLLGSVSDLPVNGGLRDVEYLTFSDADIDSDIVFANRSFFWLNYDDPATAPIETGLFPANCTTAPNGCDTGTVAGYTNDLAVLDGTVDTGDVMYVNASLLTDEADNATEYPGGGNLLTLDPGFARAVFNEGADGLNLPEFTVLATAGAFDEGGNFLQVAFGPLTLVQLGSLPDARVLYDYSSSVDIGADLLP